MKYDIWNFVSPIRSNTSYMSAIIIETPPKCYHCGDKCSDHVIDYQEKTFCCNGCRQVYEILEQNDLCQYYTIQDTPGVSRSKTRYTNLDYLLKSEVLEKLADYKDDEKVRLTFYIPSIHCASCIWLLENMQKLNPHVLQTEVNFNKKTLLVIFKYKELSLKGLVELLYDLGYEPEITLEDVSVSRTEERKNRRFTYQLGVAGFCFGNIMLFSFPEYFHLNDIIDPGFRPFFGYLNLLLAIPVMVYSGSGYFISAWQGLKHKFINIDVPLALGILVMFVRSAAEIISGAGAGFMDALAGLVFFLLIGKWFQNKTYGALSFERDYRSYFPVSITRFVQGNEEQVTLDELKQGDIIFIRNNELIPADGLLLKGSAYIDYSFVTGEAEQVQVPTGEKIYAGGKQQGGVIRMQLTKPVSQSYLTQLWNQEVFTKKTSVNITNRVNTISKYFTLVILAIALLTAIFWLVVDPSKITNAFTAVLIITCPCALALTLPFTFGNALRILTRNKLYLKNSATIEQLAKVDTVVFDKTGTITTHQHAEVEFVGVPLAPYDEEAVAHMLKTSNHPLSRAVYHSLQVKETGEDIQVEEVAGKGIYGKYQGNQYKAGSATFVMEESGDNTERNLRSSRVYISKNNEYLGYYRIKNTYRKDMDRLAAMLNGKEVHILSGDNDSEAENLRAIFGSGVSLRFEQSPMDKLQYIQHLQENNKKVLMVGDGLNDAGALKQADMGIAITEDNNSFFPACDGMLKADELGKLPLILKYSAACMQVMRYSFFISLAYNLVGLSFAVRGELLPVVAAVLMPVSSVSVILFTVITSGLYARRLNLK